MGRRRRTDTYRPGDSPERHRRGETHSHNNDNSNNQQQSRKPRQHSLQRFSCPPSTCHQQPRRWNRSSSPNRQNRRHDRSRSPRPRPRDISPAPRISARLLPISPPTSYEQISSSPVPRRFSFTPPWRRNPPFPPHPTASRSGTIRSSTIPGPASAFLPQLFNKPKHYGKPLTCYFWKTGDCRKTDKECDYAHWDTGYVAPAPKRA